MENTKFCQSCAMPLAKPEDYGTNADGSQNQDYCGYCFQGGAFTAPEMTMEQMIGFCAPYMAENTPGMTEAEARKQMEGFFPTLKRWA